MQQQTERRRSRWLRTILTTMGGVGVRRRRTKGLRGRGASEGSCKRSSSGSIPARVGCSWAVRMGTAGAMGRMGGEGVVARRRCGGGGGGAGFRCRPRL